jgi:hypothetical protein
MRSLPLLALAPLLVAVVAAATPALAERPARRSARDDADVSRLHKPRPPRAGSARRTRIWRPPRQLPSTLRPPRQLVRVPARHRVVRPLPSPAPEAAACRCARLTSSVSIETTTTVSVAPAATAEVIKNLAPPPTSAPVATFFDVPVYAAQAGVVFVLDRSGSMNESTRSPHEDNPMGRSFSHESKIVRAKAELGRALDGLPDGTRTNVIFFNHDTRAFRDAPIALDGGARRQLAWTVAQTGADGRTDLAGALERALAMRPAQIVVLSDGMNNQGARPVIDVVERYQKQRTRIDAVGLGHEHDRELLTRVAGQTGSVYRQE